MSLLQENTLKTVEENYIWIFIFLCILPKKLKASEWFDKIMKTLLINIMNMILIFIDKKNKLVNK